jgi:ABC-type transport system involved in multi-copper enzyme maturation permease subunit
MGAVAWLQIREILSGKKVWLVALLEAFPLGLTLVVVRAGGWTGMAPQEEMYAKLIFLFVLHPMLACPLLALLYGTAIVNSDVEQKTVTYLFTRPVSKWKVVVGKYLSTSAFLAGPAALSLLLGWALLGAPGGARFFGTLMGTVLASVAAYTAVFAAIGTIFRNRPLVVGILYAFFVEGILSFIPGAVINTVTVAYYLRSLVSRAVDLDIPAEATRFLGDASPLGAAAVLATITAVALALATAVVARREYPVADAV